MKSKCPDCKREREHQPTLTMYLCPCGNIIDIKTIDKEFILEPKTTDDKNKKVDDRPVDEIVDDIVGEEKKNE